MINPINLVWYVIELTQIKKGPPAGQYYPVDWMPSKGLAISQGKINEATTRDPVSAYYSIKVNDTVYHVFNAARTVTILIIPRN
jgi:hypothetical protein